MFYWRKYVKDWFKSCVVFTTVLQRGEELPQPTPQSCAQWKQHACRHTPYLDSDQQTAIPCHAAALLTLTLRPTLESQLQNSGWFGSGTGSRSAGCHSWTPGRRDKRKPCVGISLRVLGRWRVGRPPAGPAPPASSPVGGIVQRTQSPAAQPRESAWTRLKRLDTCSKFRPCEKQPRSTRDPAAMKRRRPFGRLGGWRRDSQHTVHVEDKLVEGSREVKKHFGRTLKRARAQWSAPLISK